MKSRVLVAGRPAAYLSTGGGRPVLFVHGAAGRAEVFRPQLDGLADAARVIAVDLPGHGETDGAGCRHVEEYAGWVVEFLDALGIERTVLAGHSMGGAIAQTIALEHEQRLAGLVLIGTGARLRVLPRILALWRDDPPRGADLVASLSYSPATPAGAVLEAERGLAGTAAAVALGDYWACDRFDAMERVARLRTPTLVIVGQDDRLTPPKYAAFLAATIPAARLVQIPAAGHFPQLEQPGLVTGAIRSFLDALP